VLRSGGIECGGIECGGIECGENVGVWKFMGWRKKGGNNITKDIL
jgi:hypothetical protein